MDAAVLQRGLVGGRQVPDEEVDRPQRQRDERVGEDAEPLDRAELQDRPQERPVSPATMQSGARSPSRTCWSMWNEKSRSSPSQSTGETVARSSSASPIAKRSCRQSGTGAPRPRSGERAPPVEERGNRDREQPRRLDRPVGQDVQSEFQSRA